MTGARGIAFTGTVQAVAAAACGAGQGVVGVTLFDTSAAANTVQVYDGTSTSGTLVASVTAAASSGAASPDFVSPRICTGGIYVVTTGACRGTVWIA